MPDTARSAVDHRDDLPFVQTEDLRSIRIDDLIGTANPQESGRALLRDASNSIPALAGARLEAVRIGVRPMPKDGLPMVGPIPGAANAYSVVSHSGVTLGPLWARIVTAELTTGRPDPRLEPFRPGRFITSPHN